MARPKGSDSKETHERIVQAALALATRTGPAHVTLRQVAREANVAHGTVQYYFGTREALLEACIDVWSKNAQRLLDLQLQMIEAAEDPIAVSANAVEHTWALALQHRELIRLRQADTTRAGLAPNILKHIVMPLLERTSTLLSKRLGGNAENWRFMLRSIEFLVSRFATASADECRSTLGLPQLSDAEVQARVGQHLASMTQHLFRSANS